MPVPAPSSDELAALVRTIAERIGRSPERQGLTTRDIESAYLAFDPSAEAPTHTLLGYSITYRIATGPSIWRGMSAGRRSRPSGSH